MKKYFSKITANHWIAKNRLEEAAHKVARDMERRIISGDKVTEFKKEFRDKIDTINSANPRCKPLELDIHSAYDDRGDIDIYIPSVFNFSLFLVKD